MELELEKFGMGNWKRILLLNLDRDKFRANESLFKGKKIANLYNLLNSNNKMQIPDSIFFFYMRMNERRERLKL